MTPHAGKKESGFEREVPKRFPFSVPNMLAAFAIGVIGLFLVIGFYFGIEIEKPTLEVEGVPAFVENQDSIVRFRAQDTGSGVDSVSVVIEQAGVMLPIGRFEPEGVTHEFQGKFLLSKALSGLREGQASLHIDTKDRSVWGSSTNTVFPLVVDSYEPSLQLLSAPRSMDYGGVGLFVYKAGDANLTNTGLAVGKDQYATGRPAVLMDPDLLQADLFALIAATPSNATGEWAVFASDVAGHTTRVPFSIALAGAAPGKKIVSEFTSEGALIRLLANLSRDASNGIQEVDRKKLESFRQGLETDGRKGAIAFVDFLITTIREKEWETIQRRLAIEPPTPRRWKGQMFVGPFAPRVGFGDKVVLEDEQGQVFTWVSRGEVLEPIGDARAVVAPYSGTVRMAGRLGTLGEIVVVDHGAGLASVFYSLEQRHVFEGAFVVQGQALADIGISGLHASKAARMLFLVNGQPVDPAFWRQPNGLTSAIDGALNGIKGALGIESSSVE